MRYTDKKSASRGDLSRSRSYSPSKPSNHEGNTPPTVHETSCSTDMPPPRPNSNNCYSQSTQPKTSKTWYQNQQSASQNYYSRSRSSSPSKASDQQANELAQSSSGSIAMPPPPRPDKNSFHTQSANTATSTKPWHKHRQSASHGHLSRLRSSSPSKFSDQQKNSLPKPSSTSTAMSPPSRSSRAFTSTSPNRRSHQSLSPRRRRFSNRSPPRAPLSMRVASSKLQNGYPAFTFPPLPSPLISPEKQNRRYSQGQIHYDYQNQTLVSPPRGARFPYSVPAPLPPPASMPIYHYRSLSEEPPLIYPAYTSKMQDVRHRALQVGVDEAAFEKGYRDCMDALMGVMPPEEECYRVDIALWNCFLASTHGPFPWLKPECVALTEELLRDKNGVQFVRPDQKVFEGVPEDDFMVTAPLEPYHPHRGFEFEEIERETACA